MQAIYHLTETELRRLLFLPPGLVIESVLWCRQGVYVNGANQDQCHLRITMKEKGDTTVVPA